MPYVEPQPVVLVDLNGNPYKGADEAKIAATYAPMAGFGPRIAWLGDSITQGDTDNVAQSLGSTYPVRTQLALQGRAMTVRNAGVAGNTSAAMLARFDTDVTPYAPNVVVLLAGTNDAGGAVPLATFRSNIQAIVAKIKTIGATPVLTTIPPNDDTSRVATIALYNLWLTRYAASIAAPLIDAHRILTDPTTGGYLAGFTADGTHPSGSANNALAAEAARVLTAYLRPWSPALVHEQTDTVQIVGDNPLFLRDSNSDGVPDNWDQYGDGNVTCSLVTDSQVTGKMVRLTLTGATGLHVLERYWTGGANPGDTVALSGVLTADGGTDLTVRLMFQGTNGNSAATPVSGTVTTTRGVFYQEAIVPPGTNTFGIEIVTRAGTGVVQVGQITVYNLTALGLA